VTRQDQPSTCDLLDERPELGCCVAPLRSFGGRSEFSGEIATVSCFEDNVVMREVLAEPGAGRIPSSTAAPPSRSPCSATRWPSARPTTAGPA
jgi:hypothetical protein